MKITIDFSPWRYLRRTVKKACKLDWENWRLKRELELAQDIIKHYEESCEK